MVIYNWCDAMLRHAMSCHVLSCHMRLTQQTCLQAGRHAFVDEGPDSLLLEKLLVQPVKSRKLVLKPLAPAKAAVVQMTATLGCF